jgi:hypothetical protein
MIKRIWRGWASVDNADEYEHLLNSTIVPGIRARRIAGHRGTEILRERDPVGDRGPVRHNHVVRQLGRRAGVRRR